MENTGILSESFKKKQTTMVFLVPFLNLCAGKFVTLVDMFTVGIRFTGVESRKLTTSRCNFSAAISRGDRSFWSVISLLAPR